MVSLLDSPIVSNVFSLRVQSVQEDSNFIDFVPVVLVNDALGFGMKPFRGLVIPPLIDVTHMIELSSFVIESVSDFVSYDHTNAAIVDALWKMLMIKRRL